LRQLKRRSHPLEAVSREIGSIINIDPAPFSIRVDMSLRGQS
jgi:hypothetical protein